MPSKPNKYNKRSNDSKSEADRILGLMFRQAKAQFGDAVKAFWFYEGDLCPGCLERPTGVIKMKGQNALAVNGFMYRPRSVLIGYLLCEVCANFIFEESRKNPFKQTPLHAEIEHNLADAYHKHLASLDA